MVHSVREDLLEKLSIFEVGKIIESCNLLLTYYISPDISFDKCILCKCDKDIRLKRFSSSVSCHNCVHFILYDRSCTDLRNKFYPLSSITKLRSEKPKEWTELRIEMLTNDIEFLEKYIKNMED